MEAFEYVMVLVSIVIGLAITHILTAFATAVHRIRGHGEPIRLEAVYLLWACYVLQWLVGFWWFEYKFQELYVEWPFGLYLFIVVYAVSLFMLATILVPKDMDGVADSYGFFMEGRKWFFGANIAVLVINEIDSFLKGVEWGLDPSLVLQFGVFVGASVIGLVSERRTLQVAAAAAALSVGLFFTVQNLGILGAW